MQIEVVPEAGVPGGAGPVQGAPRCVRHSLQLSMISLEIPSLSSWYCSSSLTDKEIKIQECLFALSCVDAFIGHFPASDQEPRHPDFPVLQQTNRRMSVFLFPML